MEWKSLSGRTITLHLGDITRIAADAIVNAANPGLVGGGGVDGAIHRAGGPAIMQELGPIRVRIGRCPAGDVVVTGAGDLPAQWVFHAVGPVYEDGRQGEPELLASCYRKCLQLAGERQLEIISFPAISTGVYRYPMAEAAAIAIREVKAHLSETEASLRTVYFVLFDEEPCEIYETLLGQP